MAEIGDKSFTTDMIQLIKDAVKAELGTNAYVNRYLAEVTAVNSTTSEVSVKLSGSDSASDSFRFRGLQMPEVGDQVIACIDGQDRWIESVIRPSTSTPYLQIASGSLVGAGAPTGAVLGYLFATPPSGWLLCNGGTHAYNTYPALGALFGASAGGNFTLPNMQDRFMAGLSAAGTWSNTSATTLLSPNAALAIPNHTHSTSIAHGHSENAHTHVTPKANVANAVNVISFTSTGNTSLSGAIAPAVPATGSQFNQSGTTVTHDHNFANSTLDHDHGVNATTNEEDAATNSAVFASGITKITVDLPATNVTSGNPSVTAIGTPKATLLNFIIKT